MHVTINLNFSYSCLYVHLSALFSIDTSTLPRITFKYGSLRGNVSAYRVKHIEFISTISDIESSEDNVSQTSFDDRTELADADGRNVMVDEEFCIVKFAVDREAFKFLELGFEH